MSPLIIACSGILTFANASWTNYQQHALVIDFTVFNFAEDSILSISVFTAESTTLYLKKVGVPC